MSDGLITQECSGTVADVVGRLRDQLSSRDIHLFAVIDHGKVARDAGIPMHDEVVVLFGNPAVGTQLMLRNARSGIDLPLRILIWDEQGTTIAAFAPPSTLAERFSLNEENLPIRPLSQLLESLAESIAR